MRKDLPFHPLIGGKIMSEYLITKREKCPQECDKGYFPDGSCCDVEGCRLGYIETQVPLLDVLAKLEWGEDMHGQPNIQRYRRFDNLRIREPK